MRSPRITHRTPYKRSRTRKPRRHPVCRQHRVQERQRLLHVGAVLLRAHGVAEPPGRLVRALGITRFSDMYAAGERKVVAAGNFHGMPLALGLVMVGLVVFVEQAQREFGELVGAGVVAEEEAAGEGRAPGGHRQECRRPTRICGGTRCLAAPHRAARSGRPTRQ